MIFKNFIVNNGGTLNWEFDWDKPYKVENSKEEEEDEKSKKS